MKRVLLLHTGGTLGMSGSRPTPLRPDSYAQAIVSRVPELAQLAEIETRILCNLDSSDVGPEEWSALAEEEGFVGVVAVLGVFSVVNFPDALLILRLRALHFSVVAVILAYVTYNAVYAVLSLTVIRMVPVAVALAGARLGRAAVVLVGWFGPRGLASVVFALLALEDLGQPAASQAVAVITVTVLLSVVAHGATADPLARRYGPRLAPATRGAEHASLPDVPERRLIRRVPAPASGTGADPAIDG